MAQQGLFTAGTSIEELLEKRNTRANALQQSLMANAAQGARDPMKAQAFSLLGSSLGRALAGGMEGSDKQMDALKAKNEEQKRLQDGYAAAMTGGDSQKQLVYGNALVQAGYSKEGADVILAAQKNAALEQAAADELAKEKLTNESNKRLADKVQKELPSISENARNGDADAIKFIYKFLEDKRTSTKDGVEKATAAEQNYARYTTEKKVLDTFLNSANPNTKITQAEYNRRLRLLEKGLLDYNDPMYAEQAKEDVKGVSKLSIDNGNIINTSTGKIATISQSLKILDEEGVSTGMAGEFALGFKKALYALGAPVDVTDIADAEMFRTNGLKFVMEYIQQTKGAVSDAEMKQFTAASPSLLATKAGNRLMLSTALEIAQWQENKAVYMNEWHMQKQQNAGVVRPTDWAAESRKFDKANQLVLPTASEIEAAKKGTLLTAADGSKVVPSNAFEAAQRKFPEEEE